MVCAKNPTSVEFRKKSLQMAKISSYVILPTYLVCWNPLNLSATIVLQRRLKRINMAKQKAAHCKTQTCFSPFTRGSKTIKYFLVNTRVALKSPAHGLDHKNSYTWCCRVQIFKTFFYKMFAWMVWFTYVTSSPCTSCML